MSMDLSDNGTKPLHDGHQAAEDTSAARLRKVSEYESTALARRNPLKAVLGTVNSDLMRMALQLGASINRSLAHHPETIAGVLPSIETHLKVARQIDRLAQLELKSRAAPGAAVHGAVRPARSDFPSSEDSGI